MNTPKLKPIPAPRACDHMPVNEFKQALQTRCLTPDDGNGYWATQQGFSSLPIFTDTGANPRPAWATHVVWFNK
jgi:hypothetical protein